KAEEVALFARISAAHLRLAAFWPGVHKILRPRAQSPHHKWLSMAARCGLHGNSAPTKLWREVAQPTLDHVRVVVNAKLIRNFEQECVRRRDCLVLCEFLHELIRFPGVGLAESSRAAVQVTDLVLAISRVTEEGELEVAERGI